MKPIDILTVVFTGGLFGNELAIAAFVHPSFYSLETSVHAAAAKTLASLLGRIMPFWYAAVLSLTGLGAWRHQDSLQVAAAAIAATSIAYTIAVLVPINNRIAALDPAHPYDNWLADRRAWDRYHWIRVGMLLVVVVLEVARR